MDAKSLTAANVTEQEWEQTPASVKRLIEYLFEEFGKRITALEEENKYYSAAQIDGLFW